MDSVLYARVSSKEQSEGYSIDAQLDLLREYARKKNIRVLEEFREVESAKESGRPIFNKMLAYVQQKKVPALLVEKTDRLFRNFPDHVQVDKLKIDIHYVKENMVINKDSPSSATFMQDIQLVVAKHFIDNLREESKKGMRKKAEQGGAPFLSPIGYLNQDGTVVVDTERAPLVLKAFELYAEGNQSLFTLKDELGKLGLRTKKGILITKHGLEKLLKNPFYYGYFNRSGTLWKGTHTPLISKELFDKVGSILAGKNRSKPRCRHFAFRGLLKCGYCGCMITALIQKERYIYYTCTRGKGHCEQEYYREEEIDRMFSSAIGTLYMDDKIRSWITKALLKSHDDEKRVAADELERIQTEYKKNEISLHKVYEDKLSGVITESFFKEKFSSIQQRQADIVASQESLKRKNLNYMEEGVRILELMQDIRNQYDKGTVEQKAKIMNILLYNCELKGKNTVFCWNKPFDILFEMGQYKKWDE